MATRKRKRETKKPEQFVWTTEQTAFMLAWLDQCVEQKKGRDPFQTTIVDELNKRWQRNFDWRHVYNRLRVVHAHYHNDAIAAKKSLASIFDKGTACLNFDYSYVPQELVELPVALETAKAQLKTNAIRKSSVHNRRKSRSTSLAPPTYSWRLRSHDSSVERSPARRSVPSGTPFSKQQLDVKSTASKLPNGEASFTAASHIPKPAGKGDADDRRGSFRAVTLIQDSSAGHTKPVEPFRHIYKNVFEKEEIPDTASESSLTTLSDSGLETLRQEIKTPPPIDTPPQASEISDLRLKISRLTAENMRLHNELHVAKKAMRDQEGCWRRAIAQRSKEDQLKKLLKQEAYMVKLRDQLGQARTLNRFVDTTALKTYAPSPVQVQDAFEAIFLRSKMMFAFDERFTLHVRKVFVLTPGADALLKGMFRQLEDNNDHDGSHCKLQQEVSAQHLAQAVTNAAIQHWIFEASWPDFDEGQLEILHEYRECIASGKYGIQSLQAVDGAVHQRMLKKVAFLNLTVPTKAEELAERLFESLLDIFSKFQPHLHADKTVSLLRQQQAALPGPINLALELKNNMVLVSRDYHLIHVESGAAFDKRAMEAERAEREDAPEVKMESPRVKLCLSPGLVFRQNPQIPPNEDTEMASDWSSALVQCNIPRKVYAGLGVVLCKAVVLLEPST